MKWDQGTLETKNVRISITNKHIHYKPQWICHVRELDWSCKSLEIPDESTEQQAQEAALLMVRDHLRKMLAEISDHATK